jgi:hypothetical protein
VSLRCRGVVAVSWWRCDVVMVLRVVMALRCRDDVAISCRCGVVAISSLCCVVQGLWVRIRSDCECGLFFGKVPAQTGNTMNSNSFLFFGVLPIASVNTMVTATAVLILVCRLQEMKPFIYYVIRRRSSVIKRHVLKNKKTV